MCPSSMGRGEADEGVYEMLLKIRIEKVQEVVMDVLVGVVVQQMRPWLLSKLN